MLWHPSVVVFLLNLYQPPLLQRTGLPIDKVPRSAVYLLASLMMPNGHPKIVQEMLGHSRISTTLDIYSHLSPDMQEEAVGRFATLFSERVTVKLLLRGLGADTGAFCFAIICRIKMARSAGLEPATF